MKPIPFSVFFAVAFLACAALAPAPHATAAAVPKLKVFTFARDVAPILYGKCATCHHAGEAAPFSLMSYEDARAKPNTIAAVAEQKFMPPWQAVSHAEFSNDRTLTSSQIATLKAWADA